MLRGRGGEVGWRTQGVAFSGLSYFQAYKTCLKRGITLKFLWLYLLVFIEGEREG